MGLAAGAGPPITPFGGAMEGESRELSDAGVVGWRVGADGAQGQGLAPGVGAGGDAVVDGGAEELLETVGGFKVEGGGLVILGKTPFDIHLNRHVWWCNVPAAVRRYELDGYQVLKKWLSCWERDILARPLRPEEVRHFTDTARRIAAILMAVSSVPG